MLFMVIERFRNSDPHPVGQRFQQQGRMMPDGVLYHASWIDGASMRCFQLMEAPSSDSLRGWTRHWDDLVDFEVVPVETSHDFWKRIGSR